MVDGIGNIVGLSKTDQFLVAIAPEKARLQDIVALDTEIDGTKAKVWGRIVDIERINPFLPRESAQALATFGLDAFETVMSISREMITAKCQVIGAQIQNEQELIPLMYPPKPASQIYHPSPESIQTIFIGQIPDHRQLSVGTLRARNDVEVLIDSHMIVSRHLAILAMTGAGKSYACRKIIEELTEETGYPILIFDPHGDYLGLQDLYPDYLQIYLGQIDFKGEDDNVLIQFIQELGGTLTPAQEELAFAIIQLLKNENRTTEFKRIVRDSTGRRPDRSFDFKNFYAIVSFCTYLIALHNLEEWRSEIRGEISAISSIVGRAGVPTIGALRRSALKAANEYKQMQRMNMSESASEEITVSPLPSAEQYHELIELDKISIINMTGYSDSIRQAFVSSILSRLLDLRINGEVPKFLTVLEEAHNFIPGEGLIVPSSSIVKRIATEGRKFGVGLILISQRPSRVDSTVLSQCNSYIIMRIVNPADQRFVRDVVETLGKEDTRLLPELAVGEALISGQCIKIPFPILARMSPPESEEKYKEEDFIEETLKMRST